MRSVSPGIINWDNAVDRLEPKQIITIFGLNPNGKYEQNNQSILCLFLGHKQPFFDEYFNYTNILAAPN